MISRLDEAYNPEVVDQTLGLRDGYQRTALNVDFHDTEAEALAGRPPAVVDPRDISKDTFNAVAAASIADSEMLLPVLSLKQNLGLINRVGAGFVIECSGEGSYTERSVLKDVVGDHGLGELEVHQDHRARPHAIRWRPRDEGQFAYVPQASRGAYLFIQRAIPKVDHDALIRGLDEVGAISPGWAGHAVEEGGRGGVVLAPWALRPAY